MSRKINLLRMGGTFVLLLVLAKISAAADPPDTWECRFTDKPITIDGKADEEAWKNAQVIDNFRMAWLRGPDQKPRSATKARLLWDRDFLYFFAELQDTDIYADITQHQGQIWENDVFELFFKPAQDKTAYYEFEVSANNTTLELFFPSRGAGGYRRFKDVTHIKMESAVVVRGTINHFEDKDEGWSVEGRIPWRDMHMTGGRPNAGDIWKFSLSRFDYSTGLDKPEQTSCAPLTRPDFHRYEDFATLRFVGPQTAASDKPLDIRHTAPSDSRQLAKKDDDPRPHESASSK